MKPKACIVSPIVAPKTRGPVWAPRAYPCATTRLFVPQADWLGGGGGGGEPISRCFGNGRAGRFLLAHARF